MRKSAGDCPDKRAMISSLSESLSLFLRHTLRASGHPLTDITNLEYILCVCTYNLCPPQTPRSRVPEWLQQPAGVRTDCDPSRVFSLKKVCRFAEDVNVAAINRVKRQRLIWMWVPQSVFSRGGSRCGWSQQGSCSCHHCLKCLCRFDQVTLFHFLFDHCSARVSL